MSNSVIFCAHTLPVIFDMDGLKIYQITCKTYIISSTEHVSLDSFMKPTFFGIGIFNGKAKNLNFGLLAGMEWFDS